MGSRDKEFTTKIKQAFDLVEFVSQSVALKRSGKYFTGLSPFSKEKSPSFFVNPEKQTFHCYSTDQGGDIIDFVMLTQGYSFPEALEFLANKAGIPLEKTNRSPEQIAKDRAEEEEKKLYLKLNQFAAKFYQDQLEGPAGALARDYVKKRAIEPEFQLAFALGYAPDSWTALRDYFLKIQAPLLKAYHLGLFRTKGGEPPKADGSNLFDTFRNRLVFPIRGAAGEVLGFGGRWLGASNADAPKYLNSMESPVYEKDKVLYNLDQARKSIRDSGTVVLVEGYMDCLALVQAGFSNVVANCGTALTKTQAGMLRKMAPKIICFYDADAAGQAATERAMDLFLETEGVPLLGAKIPDGKDPDEFLRSHGEEGKLKMAEILQNSPALIDEWINSTIASTSHTLQARTDALDKITRKLAKLREDLWVQARLNGIAKGLSMEESLVRDAVQRLRKGLAPARPPSANAAPVANPLAKSGPNISASRPANARANQGKEKQISISDGKRDLGFERRFLRDLLQHPSWISLLRAKHLQNASVVLPLMMHEELRGLLERILQPLESGELEEDRIERELESCRENPLLRNILSSASVREENTLPDSDLDVALARLKDDFLKQKAAILQLKIREAQTKGNEGEVGLLFQELMDLETSRKRAKNNFSGEK